MIANGARWVRSRRLLTPAFHFDILKPYLKVYAEAADTLVVGLNPAVPYMEQVLAIAFNMLFYIGLVVEGSGG